MIIERNCLLFPSLSYKNLLELQEKEFDLRVNCRKNGIPMPGDIVLFVVHKPVYTLGRHGIIGNLLSSAEELESKNIEFVHTNRGGDITYHGPGQLTVYPIIDLLRYNLGIKDYVFLLEECVIQTLHDYGVTGERIEGKTGVWIDRGSIDERKICAIGIRSSRFVTMHGFALNVSSDISNFNGIVPCGLQSGVTSLSIEAGREIPVEEVADKIWESLKRLLLPRIPAREIS